MENSFKKLGEPLQETPKELKKVVVKRIATFTLFTDLFGLFFNDLGDLAKAVFKKR
jgi:hypothetical protein